MGFVVQHKSWHWIFCKHLDLPHPTDHLEFPLMSVCDAPCQISFLSSSWPNSFSTSSSARRLCTIVNLVGASLHQMTILQSTLPSHHTNPPPSGTRLTSASSDTTVHHGATCPSKSSRLSKCLRSYLSFSRPWHTQSLSRTRTSCSPSRPQRSSAESTF